MLQAYGLDYHLFGSLFCFNKVYHFLTFVNGFCNKKLVILVKIIYICSEIIIKQKTKQIMRNFKIFALLFALVAFTFISCENEDALETVDTVEKYDVTVTNKDGVVVDSRKIDAAEGNELINSPEKTHEFLLEFDKMRLDLIESVKNGTSVGVNTNAMRAPGDKMCSEDHNDNDGLGTYTAQVVEGDDGCYTYQHYYHNSGNTHDGGTCYGWFEAQLMCLVI